MGVSIPTALVAVYAIYCETKVRYAEQRQRTGEIYFLKMIGFPYRLLVYLVNTGIAFYNYATGFDDYFMAALLMLSMNVVVNISKIVIEEEKIVIGNTKVSPSDFELVELKKLDEKNAKLTFAALIRKRRFQRDLYLPLNQMEPLKIAIDRVKGKKSKNPSKDKKG